VTELLPCPFCGCTEIQMQCEAASKIVLYRLLYWLFLLLPHTQQPTTSPQLYGASLNRIRGKAK
jgi:hypothetical protein